MKRLLAPIETLGVPVLGVISDAQHTERLAVAQLWPHVPHQTCQFHYLREASQPIYDLDRKTRTALRKTVGTKLRKTRNQLAYHLRKEYEGPQAQAEQEQLQVLSDYVLAITTALNLDGNQPFAHAGVAAFDALEAIEGSLLRLEKKEHSSAQSCK